MLSAIGRCSIPVVLLLVLSGGPTEAQTVEEREVSRRPRAELLETGYLNVNVAHWSDERSLSQRLSSDLYNETAVFDVRHASPTGVGLDGAIGLRVWNNLAVGLGVAHVRVRSRVDVTGTVPHPLFYGRPREAQHQPGGFGRAELGIHLHAAWTIRLADRLDLTLSAGPSLFRVKQDRVSGIDAIEAGSTYDEVQVDVSRASVRKQVSGANIGMDLTYHLARNLEPGTLFWTAGVGIYARWTMGTSALTEFGPDQAIEVGGLQAGVGLRFRF